tara:strand:- start:1118 stop:1933 length:816 start_codon:yes stop_codon:yes gene_type:complete
MARLTTSMTEDRTGPPPGLPDPDADSRSESGNNLEDTNEKASRELEARLTTVEANAKDANEVARLIAIPEVRDVLTALQDGKDVKVLTGVEAGSGSQAPLPESAQAPPSMSAEDLDEMSNAQLTDHIVQSVGSSLSSNLKGIISEQLKPIEASIGRAESFIGRAETDSMQRQARELGAKYEDFNEYKDRMIELNTQNPSLNLEQLYHLAKLDAGSPVTPLKGMSTERPGTMAGRTPREPRPSSRPPVGPGRRAMGNRISEILDSQDWSRFD